MAVLFPDYKQKPEVKIKTVDKVRRCHNRGLSLKETAQELGITSCTVRRYGFNWDGPRYPDFSPQQPLTNHYTEKENFFIKLSQQYIEEKELEERLDLERHGFA